YQRLSLSDRIFHVNIHLPICNKHQHTTSAKLPHVFSSPPQPMMPVPHIPRVARSD
ncbi:hypothetical protein COCVIDRAFT_105755, partial [Bipolaris victoriae FI3]